MMECRLFKSSLSFRSIAVACLTWCGLVFVLSLSSGQAQTDLASRPQAVVGSRIAPGMLNERGEEIVSRGSGFSAVMTLRDRDLEALLDTGSVALDIPTSLINNIESVIIKRPLYFKDKQASDYADAELSGQKLLLNVDDSVIDRIDYQPVELKVYESNFTSVVIRYVGFSKAKDRDGDVGDPATDSPMITVTLDSGKGIHGRIRGMKNLKIDSTLGRIDVPFTQTKNISVRENGELTVQMANGDRISGKMDGEEIELLNRWGTETISLSDISSMSVKRARRKRNKPLKRATAF